MSESDRQEEASPEPEPGDAPIDAEFEPAPEDAPRSRQGPGWFALLLVLVLAMAGGTLGGTVLTRATATDPAAAGRDAAGNPQDLGELRRQVSSLSERVDAIAPRLDRLDGAAAMEADVTRRFDSIERRLDTVAARLDEATDLAAPAPGDGAAADTSGLTARVRALANQAERTETQLADVDSRVESQDRRIDRLAQTLEALTGTLSTLRADLDSLDPADTGLGERVGSLADQVSQLEARLDDRLADLAGRIETVRVAGQAAAEASRAALSLAEIEAAARRGQGFQPAWRDLRAARPDDPVVADLEDLALEGAPTRETLARRLDTLDASLRAAQQADASGAEGLVERLSGGQIQIRRDGETGPDVAVETARTALAAGDLGGAIGALESLTGPALDVAAPWIEDARRRRDLERTIDRLRLTLMREEGPTDP